MWSQLRLGSLQPGTDLENRTQTMISMAEEKHAAVTAFVEERPPAFGAR